MPLPYSLFVRHELYEVIRQLRPTWRNKVVQFFESLASDPFQSGDYTERDATDRILHIKVIGAWAIMYWADHAASEVKIVHILPSDR